jgi:hypothetical protein
MESAKLKQAHDSSVEFVSKIGRREPHLTSFGKIHRLDISTEITHQESPSARNYWKDADFDAALAEVVRRRFHNLASEALALMHTKYVQKRISEKGALLAQIAEIEALESESGA